jgi:hypothetical protein
MLRQEPGSINSFWTSQVCYICVGYEDRSSRLIMVGDDRGHHHDTNRRLVSFVIFLLLVTNVRKNDTTVHGFTPVAVPTIYAHYLYYQSSATNALRIEHRRTNINKNGHRYFHHDHHYQAVPTTSSSTSSCVENDIDEGMTTTTTEIVMPDYLIFDSSSLDNDDDIDDDDGRIRIRSRPKIVPFLLLKPRNVVATALVIDGIGITLLNVMGQFDGMYLQLIVGGVILGFINAVWDWMDSQPPYMNNIPTDSVSSNIRTGVVDDAVLHMYSAIYTTSACWLALRTSLVCPEWLPSMDIVFGVIAVSIFAFSFISPLLTLIHHHTTVGHGEGSEGLKGNINNSTIDSTTFVSQSLRLIVGSVRKVPKKDLVNIPLPPLSETELLRANGLLAIGIVACIYIPEVLSFLLLHQDWWIRVGKLYPGQSWAESSYAVSGVIATQTSMIAHRSGKVGIASFRTIVPIFAAICVLLTILPCISTFYWWGNKISFFDFYSV